MLLFPLWTLLLAYSTFSFLPFGLFTCSPSLLTLFFSFHLLSLPPSATSTSTLRLRIISFAFLVYLRMMDDYLRPCIVISFHKTCLAFCLYPTLRSYIRRESETQPHSRIRCYFHSFMFPLILCPLPIHSAQCLNDPTPFCSNPLGHFQLVGFLTLGLGILTTLSLSLNGFCLHCVPSY